MSAPSAWNARPWHFIVIDDKEKLSAIPEVHPYAHMVKKAPFAILVCGEESSNEKANPFFQQNCAAATENILIHATELGLGSVWVGIYPEEDKVEAIRKLFNIPETIIPFSLIPVGHPKGVERKTKDRYDSSKTHRNQW